MPVLSQAACRPGNPRLAESGPRFPVPGRIGKRPDSRFPSDVRASTAVNSEYTQPRVACQCSHRQHAAPIQGPREREHAAASDEHQLQWTRNILSREYHASALTGSMRLLFRVREREHAAVICLPRLRKVTTSGSRNLPVAQPGTMMSCATCFASST